MIAIRPVKAATILQLRYAVLRPNRPLKESLYPTDSYLDTVHLGAYDDYRLVGCASAHVEPLPETLDIAYRLRGMAVHEQYRNQGIGGRLLAELDEVLRDRSTNIVWCNGRLSAANFYQRHGWEPVGEEFEIIEIPHMVFVKFLEPADPLRPAGSL